MSQSIFFVENGHHSLKKHLNVICHFLKKFFLLFLSRFNASTVLLLIGKKTSEKKLLFFIFYREKKIWYVSDKGYLQAWNIYFAFEVEYKYYKAGTRIGHTSWSACSSDNSCWIVVKVHRLIFTYRQFHQR